MSSPREPHENDDSVTLPHQRLSHPEGFEICWAGPHPYKPTGFCFGSMDGKIQFMDDNMRPTGEPRLISKSQEAINGVAGLGLSRVDRLARRDARPRFGYWLGVSTREAVDVTWFGDHPPGISKGMAIPNGAHDIVSSADGCFLAPMGIDGLTVLRPSLKLEHNSAISYSADGWYAYRVATSTTTRNSMLMCASRQFGVATGRLVKGEPVLRTAPLAGQDIIDVCSIESRGMAALSRSGSVILFRDMLDTTPRSFTARFPKSIQGVAYRVFYSHGHIVILTSKGLHVVGELAARFWRHDPTVDHEILKVPLEAVDANIVRGRWLFVMLTNELCTFDLDVIDQVVRQRLEEARPPGLIRELPVEQLRIPPVKAETFREPAEFIEDSPPWKDSRLAGVKTLSGGPAR
jgi:hypothetical protein